MNLQQMNKTKSKHISSITKNYQCSYNQQRKLLIGQKSKIINPEEQIRTLNQNDSLVRMISFENGNALKDCKAILDSLKEQFFQEKQKLLLFYKDDYNQLIDDLNINMSAYQNYFNKNLSISQTDSKAKNPKINKPNNVFQNYKKLMQHSLRQTQKGKFLAQAQKINKSNMNRISQLGNDPKFKKSLRNINIKLPNQTKSVLEKFIDKKKNQMVVQNSSKLNFQQKNLQQIMRNRKVCEKILEEALMFQRYYDILKKNKLQILDPKSKTQRKLKTQTSQKQQRNVNIKRRPSSIRYRKSGNSSFMKIDTKQNSLCKNPRHLRLTESQSRPQAHAKSQQDYVRNKYIHKLKIGEYYKQINRINDEFIEKRNNKNNLLIADLLGFIRNNSVLEEQFQDQALRRQLSQNRTKQSDLLRSTNKQKATQPQKPLSGASLTKILRKLFLIYSFSQGQESGVNNESVLTKQNISKFFNDFQIDVQKIIQRNQKIKQIVLKQIIDQFQFIQLIHLMTFSIQQNQNFDNYHSEGSIYTNISSLVTNKFFNDKFLQFLSIEEQRVLKMGLKKTVQKLRKLNRFQDKMSGLIDLFVESEMINKLLLQSVFEDFDYVLQVLWYMKIYPVYVNKKTVRFYFQYLKQNNLNFIFGQSELSSKNKYCIKLQNIVWLIIAKISIQKFKQLTQQHQSNSQKLESVSQQCKNLQNVFVGKFKIILNLLNDLILDKNTNVLQIQNCN